MAELLVTSFLHRLISVAGLVLALRDCPWPSTLTGIPYLRIRQKLQGSQEALMSPAGAAGPRQTGFGALHLRFYELTCAACLFPS